MNGVDANDDDERHSFTISMNIFFFLSFSVEEVLLKP
jgi:hypothetical protein